jgi:trk system potassium uptake protein TrkH
VISAAFTVGLGAGTVGPDLETPLKLILCAVMLLGRLEIVAFLILLYPRSWRSPGAAKR